MANVDIRLGHKDTAWFTANPTLVLKDGQMVVCSDGGNIGKYKIGDGTTQLSLLTFYGGISTSPAWGVITGTLSNQTDLQNALNAKQNSITTGTTLEYFRGDLSLATFPTNISSFNNDSGYITSSALSPYLTSANAALTYEPIFSKNTAFNKNFGTGTTNIVEIGSTLGNSLLTSTDANGKLQTLITSTYPSLTEISYVKGVTSAIQTQINNKYDASNPSGYITSSALSPYLTSASAALTYQPLSANLTSWASVTRATNFDTFVATPSSANLAALITDETGSGKLVFDTSPTISTSLTVTAGSTTTVIRDLVGTSTAGAIYLNQASPSTTNYALMDDGSSIYLNGRSANSIYISTAAINIVRFGPNFQIHTPTTVTSGSTTTFSWTKPNNTGQTASTAINGFLFTSGSRQWATGAITTQKEFEITSPTYSFVGASTIAEATTLNVTAPTAGTNATITNNFALGLLAGTATIKMGNLTGSSTTPALYMNAATPSSTNYTISTTTTNTSINAQGGLTSNLLLQVTGNTKFAINGSSTTTPNFVFTTTSAATIAASTELNSFVVNGKTDLWGTGTLATQRYNYFKSNTLSFAGTSIATNVYGLYVEATTAGANSSITNNWGIGFTGGLFKNSIGNTVLSNAALSTSATDGFVYIPTSAGAPTGVPTNFTGVVAMQYDTTNNKLYIYNGGWKSVTLA